MIIQSKIYRVYSVSLERYFQCVADSQADAVRIAEKVHGKLENPAAIDVDTIVVDTGDCVV